MSLTMNLATIMLWTIIVAASLFGCADPLINSPAAETKSTGWWNASSPVNVRPSAAPEAAPRPGSGTLSLEEIVRVPGVSPVAFASIRGSVTYTLTSMPYRRAFRINLDVSTSATLVPEEAGATVWHAEGKSHDRLFLLQGGSILLEKDYTVVGSERQTELRLRLLLTPTGISLEGMGLELVNPEFSGLHLESQPCCPSARPHNRYNSPIVSPAQRVWDRFPTC